MSKRRRVGRRRAITAVLSGIILLALIETVLLGYFLFVVNGDLLGNKANQGRQDLNQAAASEKLAVLPSLNGAALQLSVTNDGRVSSTINAVYVTNSSGALVSYSATSRSPYLVGQPDLTVSLPLTVNPGQSTANMTACNGGECNVIIETTAFCWFCNQYKSVLVSVLTSYGNTFSAQYPVPSVKTTTTFTTTIPNTVMANFTGSATTTQTTHSSTTTTVLCSNCETTTVVGQGTPSMVLYLKACPSGSLSACSTSVSVYNGGGITLIGNVTNLSSQSATGVQLFIAPASGITTGTASVTSNGACTPSSQTVAAKNSSLITCSFTGYSGSSGGTVTFVGYAAGTISHVYTTSAEATSNPVQIGNVVSTGSWLANSFTYNFESTTQLTPASANYISAGNAYVSYYVGVKNNFNQSMTILDESFMLMGRLGPDPTFFIVQGASYTGGTHTLTSYNCYPGESSTAGCYNVAIGATQMVTLAACPPTTSASAGSTTWGWSNTGGGGGCSLPTWSPVEGDSVYIVIFYTISSSCGKGWTAACTLGPVYSQTLPLQSTILTWPSTLSVACSPTSVAVGSPSTCTGTVTSSSSTISPTGTLLFTVSPTTGTLNPVSGACTLTTVSATQAKCSVTFTPSAGGTYTITATYAGDSYHGPASGSTTLATSVKVPILIATPTGGSAFTYTVSGCSVSPTTGTSGPTATTFAASSSCVLTVTMPTATTYTRYVFALSASSTTVTTCTVATCPTFQPSDYYQLQNTWRASTSGQGPPTWDSGLSITPTGTVAGTGGTDVCTISPTSGTTTTATCAGWSDYGTAVTAPSTATGAGSNIRWELYGTSSYTPTTGGNTETAFAYYKQVSNTYEITANAQTSFDPGLTALTITGTVGGTAGTTLCTITTSGASSPAICSTNPVWSDYNTAVTGFTNPLGGAPTNSRWEASTTCSFTPTSGGNTENCNYWKQWTNGFQYSVTDGGSPTAPTLSCNEYGSTATLTLTTSSQAFYCDNGASATATNPTTGSTSSERWSDNAKGFVITAGGATDTFAYYNQYSLTLSYSISGGGSPTAPTLSCTQFGGTYTPSLTTTAAAYWCDSTHTWTVSPNPLTGSGLTERWQTTQTLTGTVSATQTTVFTFYNQYSYTLSYSVSGGGTPTAPTLTSTQFGASYTPTLTTTATAYWLDAGASWSVTNPLTPSGSSQRWYSPQTVSGTVSPSSPTTPGGSLIFIYNSQYGFTLSYSVTYGGTGYSAPTLTSTQYGASYTPTLTTTATAYWLDAGASWSVTNPLSGSGITERWQSGQTTSGTVSSTSPATAGGSLVFAYYNQYLQILSYSVTGGGSPTAPTATGTEYGSAYAPSLTTTATAYWFDATGTVAFTNPLSGSGSTERWETQTASVLATQSNTQVVAYYNQYSQTLSYNVNDGGTGYNAPATIGGLEFGSAYNPTLTTTATAYWFDATGTLTFTNPLTGSGSTERWAENSISVPLTSSNTIVVQYYNQYKQTLSYSVVYGGSPTAPTATGTEYGSAYAPSLTTTATAYWFDATGTITVSTPTSGSTERWSPSPASVSATVSNTQVFNMYNQYLQTLSYSITDGGTGYTAPTATGTELGSSYTPSLTTAATGYWFDATGTVTFTNPLSGSGSTERWETQTASVLATQSNTQVVAYYNQFTFTLSYSIHGGGTPTAPTLTSTQFGASYTPTLTTTATAYWLDSGQAWSVTNPLTGSGSTQRWYSSQTTSGTVSSSSPTTAGGSLVFAYYNQYGFTLSYSVTYGGTGYSAPTLTSTQYGVSYTPTLTTTATAYWLDSGASWSVTNPLSGSGSTERWQSTQTVSGTVSSTSPTTAGGSLVFAYYNQYLHTLSYAVVDGGTPTAPTATGVQFGSAYAPSLTTTATGYWYDATGTIAVSTPTSGASERWSPSPASVSATVSNTQVFNMYNQYLHTLSYTVIDGGTPTAPTATGTSLGSAYAPSLTTTATGYWYDATGTIAVSTPTSGASERWSPSPASVSATVSNTQVFSMYNQYLQTLSYSIIDGGTGYTAPTATGTELGSSYTPSLTTAATGYWFDATGTVTFTNPLSGSGSTERWETQTASVLATQSNTQVVAYYNQYLHTLSYTVVDGGTPTAPTASGLQFGSAYAPSLTTTATGYWFDATGTVTFSTSTGTNEQWAPSPSSVSATASNTQVVSMYNQFALVYSYSVSGGGTPTAPTLSCTQLGGTYTPSLTTTATTYWCDGTHTWTVSPNPLTGSSSTERWDSSQSLTGMASATLTTVFTFYNQFTFTLSYSIHGGGTPTAPTLTSTQFGVSYTPTLTTAATAYWLDSNQAWSVTNPLTGSGSTERWYSSQTTSGTVSTTSPTTAGGSLVFAYYNQYGFTLSYSVTYAGSGYSAPTLTSTQSGLSYTPVLTTTATAYWLDSGASWSTTSLLTGSGSTERWQSTQTVSGTVSSTSPTTAGGSLVFAYYNQYLQTLSYSVVYGGSPTAPTATGTQFGSAYAPSLTTTATGYWFDATGSIAISTPTGTNEQWAPSPASVSATASNTQVVSMYNQYLHTLSYTVVDGGTPTAPTATGTSLGSAYAPSLTTTATGYWFDATGTITISTPTSGSTERWSPSPVSVSATVSNTQVFSMYNQYLQTLSYSITDGGTGYTAPTATGTELGSAYAPSLTTTATGYWFDATGTVAFTNPLSGSGSTERWQTQTTSVSATLANTQVVAYYNQYFHTLSYTVVDGGTPTAPTATGVQFGSAYAPSLTTTATGYWYDATGTITVSTPTSGSTERWSPSPASVSATASNTQVFSMYNQFSFTLSYSVSGGGSPTAPTLTGTQLGSSYTPSLTSIATAYWLDSGQAWSVTNPLGTSSSTQRWETSQTVSGTVSATVTTAYTYYNQLSNTYQASPITNGGKWDAALSIPVTGTVGGTASTTGCSIATTKGGGAASCTTWFDYDTQVTVTSPVTVSSREQWTASNTNTFTQTTGGNANNVNYIIHLTTSVTEVQQVAGASKTASPFTCAFGTNPTAGDLITVAFSYYSSTLPTVTSVTDTLGSSFTQIGTDTTTSTAPTESYIYAAMVPSTGADTITVRLSANPTAAFVTCIEWSGVTSVTPVTAPVGTLTGATSPLSAAVASFTPNSGDLIYTYVGFTSCTGTGTITYNTAAGYTAGTAKGTDITTGATCGGGHTFYLNEADEMALDWTSGSTTSTFSIAMTNNPSGGRTSGWAEIAVEFDPPSASSSPPSASAGNSSDVVSSPTPPSTRHSVSSPAGFTAIGLATSLVSFAAITSIPTASEVRPPNGDRLGRAKQGAAQGASPADLVSAMDSETAMFKRNNRGPIV